MMEPLIPVESCLHPLPSGRLDGFWPGEMFEDAHARASVTCLRCGGSFNVPLRADLARLHGGSRALAVDMSASGRAVR